MPSTAITNLSNSEIVKALGLPKDIITRLQTEQGDTFSATANQFISALVNKIVYSKVDKMEFANPFKKFESFPVRYGDTIENIFVEICHIHFFDPVKNCAIKKPLCDRSSQRGVSVYFISLNNSQPCRNQ